MKKGLIVAGLVIGLACSSANVVSAEENNSDMQKLQTISEIGTMSNTGYYEDALVKCDQALKKYPKEPELYYWSATIKSKLGDEKSAIKDYDKAIELSPKNGAAYVMRGITKSDVEDFDGAIADFNKALEINPKDSSALSMRACVKIQIGDIDGALKDMQVANKLMDEEAEKK